MSNNNSVVEFPSMERRKIKYKIIKILTKDVDGGYGQYPAICTVDVETGILINATKLEFYLYELIEKGNCMATLEDAAKVVVRLMNYLIQKETINGIHEIDRSILRRFEEHLKIKNSGNKPSEEQISPDTWDKYLNQLHAFLKSYYKKNCNKVEFRYDPEDCRIEKKHIDEFGGKESTVYGSKKHTSPPENKPKKCRYLPRMYLDLFKEEFKIHDPELYFAIELQRASGIREGELLNLTRDRIHVPAGAGDIILEVERRSDFVKEHKGKTPIGSIKKYREQKVYPAFNYEVKKAYKEHLLREEQKFKRLGKTIDPKGPLFTNTYGNPLKVSTYNKRCRDLFFKYFVPDLEEYCIATGQYDVNKALIDAYKKDFIGCHALRHWFTMYLKVTEGLDDEQVRNWRGDESVSSYRTYMHRNQEILENFEKVCFRFQTEMLMAIKYGRVRRYLEGGEK